MIGNPLSNPHTLCNEPVLLKFLRVTYFCVKKEIQKRRFSLPRINRVSTRTRLIRWTEGGEEGNFRISILCQTLQIELSTKPIKNDLSLASNREQIAATSKPFLFYLVEGLCEKCVQLSDRLIELFVNEASTD